MKPKPKAHVRRDEHEPQGVHGQPGGPRCSPNTAPGPLEGGGQRARDLLAQVQAQAQAPRAGPTTGPRGREGRGLEGLGFTVGFVVGFVVGSTVVTVVEPQPQAPPRSSPEKASA